MGIKEISGTSPHQIHRYSNIDFPKRSASMRGSTIINENGVPHVALPLEPHRFTPYRLEEKWTEGGLHNPRGIGGGIRDFFIIYFRKIGLFKRFLTHGEKQIGQRQERLALLSQVVRAMPDEGASSSYLLFSYLAKEIGGENPEIGKRLEQGSKWAKAIEALQKRKTFSPQTKPVKRLIQDIKNQVRHLQEGQSLLIPGGWQKGDGTFADAVYEVSKKPDGTFSIKYLSLDAHDRPLYVSQEAGEVIRHSPLLEFHNITLDELDQALAPLIYVQLPALYGIKVPFLARLLLKIGGEKKQDEGRGIRTYLKQCARQLRDEQGAEQHITPLEVMHACFNKIPTIPPESTAMLKLPEEEKNHSKVLFAYLKTISPHIYDATKINLKLNAFFACLNAEGGVILSNRSLRQMAYESANKLLRDLEKRKRQLNMDEAVHQHLVEELETILHQILEKEKSEQVLPVPSRLRSTPFRQRCTLPKPFASHQLVPLEPNCHVFKALNIKPLSPPSTKTATVAEQAALWQSFSLEMEKIRQAYNEGNDRAVEAAAIQLALQLPTPNVTGDFWQGIEDSLIIEQWRTSLLELNECLFDAQQMDGARPFAQKTAAQLNLLAIGDRLLVLAAKHDERLCDRQGRVMMWEFKTNTALSGSNLYKFLEDNPYFAVTSPHAHRVAQSALHYYTQETEERVDDPLRYERQDKRALCPLANWSTEERYVPLPEYIQYQAREKGCSPQAAYQEIEIEEGREPILPKAVLQQKKMCVMAQAICFPGIGMSAEGNPYRAALKVATPRLEKDELREWLAVTLMDEYADLEMRDWIELSKLESREIHEKWRSQGPKPIAGQRRPHTKWQQITGKKLHHNYFKLSPAGINYQLITNSFSEYKENSRTQKRWLNEYDFGIYASQGEATEGEIDYEIFMHQFNDRKNTHHNLYLKETLSEEEKALCAVQTKRIRVDQACATYMAHPEWLDHPSHRRFFELALFRSTFHKTGIRDARLPHSLLTVIEEAPQRALDLLRFARDQSKSEQEVHLPRALFLHSLYHKIRRCVEETDLSKAQKDHILAQFPNEDLFPSMVEAAHTPRERYMAHTAQLIYLLGPLADSGMGDQALSMNSDLLQRIAISLVHYRSTALPPSERNLAIEAEIEHLLSLVPVHAHLEKGCTSDKKFSAQLLKGVLPPDVRIEEEQITGTPSQLIVEDYTLDLATYTLRFKDRITIPIPPEIAHDERLKQLFGHPLPHQVEVTPHRDSQTGEEVYMYPLEGNGYKVEVFYRAGLPPCIQMRDEEGKLFELLPLMTREAPGGERPFGEATDIIVDRLVWCEVDKPTHLVVSDPRSAHPLKSPLYQIILAGKGEKMHLHKVIRCKDHAYLLNPWQHASQLAAMCQIEDSTHIYAWGKRNGIVTEVEFPRLKMADGTPLTYQVQDGRLFSKQFSSYITTPLLRADGQPILPPFFRAFHLLKPEKGRRKKVLIPLQPLTRVGKRYANWSHCATMDHRSASLEYQPVLEFSVNPLHERLESNQREANGFLAYLFFAHKQYDEAVEYLKKSQTAMPLSSGHRLVHQWINEWPDDTPQGVAFRLKALLALKENYAKQGERVETAVEELQFALQLEELYNRYGTGLIDIPARLHLTSDEEKIYTRAVAQTHAAAMERNKEPHQHKKWQPPQRDTVKDYEGLYKKMKSRPTLPSPNECLPTDPAPFVEAFRALYQLLATQEVTNPEYMQWAAFVMMAQPMTDAARTGHQLLRDIVQWRKIHPEEELLMEVGNPPSGGRYKGEDDLEAWFNRVIAKLKVQQEVVPPVPDRQPIWREREGGDLAGTAEMVEALDKGKSHRDVHVQAEEVAQAHRLEQWKVRKREAKSALPPLPEGNVNQEQSIRIKSSSAILSFSAFNVLPAEQQLPIEEQGQELNDLFQPCMMGQEQPVDRVVHTLATHYWNDATYALSHQPPQEALAWNQGYSAEKVQQQVTSQREQVSWERKKCEETLLDRIAVDNRSRTQQLLSPLLKSVPNRLIGLYVDGKTDCRSLNAVLGLSLENEDDAQEISRLLQQWMIGMIQERILQQTVEWMEGYQVADWNDPDMQRALHERLSVQRHFDPNGPHGATLLAIEYQGGVVLRENQVDMIEAMLEDPNCVKQLGMGQGKSSIILPFSLNHAADGTHLAVGIIPEGQYEGVSEELDKSFSQLFGRDILRFSFDMDQALDLEWLMQADVFLWEAVGKRRAVITTKRSLLSLRNAHHVLCKSYEQLRKKERRNETEEAEKKVTFEKLKRVGSMLTLFRDRGQAVADEMDSILDVRQELNCEVGDPEAIEAERWQVGIEIYRALFTHPELKEYARELKANEQAKWTEQEIGGIQSHLCRHLLNEWYPDSTEKEQVQFEKYALEKENIEKPPFIQVLKEENVELYHRLSYLRHYLRNTLPTTFSSSERRDYIRAPNGNHTIPAREGIPQVGSRHGEEFEQIAYAIQDYLQMGLSDAQGKQWVEERLASARREAEEKGKLIGQTTIAQQFQKTYHISLIQAVKNPEKRRSIVDTINADTNHTLQFLSTDLFPYLTRVPLQVSANAHTLVSMFKRFGGFTGTTWNTPTFARSIHTEKAHTLGTDGKTVIVLMKMKSHIAILEEEKDPLNQIAEGKYDAVIDAGAYFKNKETEEVIDQLMQNRTDIKAAVYVTEEGEKAIKPYGNEEPRLLAARTDIHLEERITYYAQKDVIGTDIVQKQHARAALTIGERMYVKDLFQAVWRMRQLGKGQTIDYFITAGVRKRILEALKKPEDHEITFQDILLFCIKNQAERKAEDNLRAEQQRLEEIVPIEMMWQIAEALEKAESPEEFDALCESTFQYYFPHLVRKQGNTPDDLAEVAQQVDTLEVLKHHQRELTDRYQQVADQLGDNSPIACKQGLQKAINHIVKEELIEKEQLADKTEQQNARRERSEVRTQQKQQQQQQQQQQVQVESSHVSVPPGEKRKWQHIRLRTIDHELSTGQLESLKRINVEEIPLLSSKPLSVDFYMGPNFAPSADSGHLLEALSSPYHVPMGQVLVIKTNAPKKFNFILLDPGEYQEMEINHSYEKTCAIYDIRPQQGCMRLCSTSAAHGNPWIDPEEEKLVQEQLIRLKVMSGKSHFPDEKEGEALQRWLEKEGEDNKLAIKKVFEEKCLPYGKYGQYYDSTLYKLFSGKKV